MIIIICMKNKCIYFFVALVFDIVDKLQEEKKNDNKKRKR